MNKINISHKERERHDFALQLETVIQKKRNCPDGGFHFTGRVRITKGFTTSQETLNGDTHIREKKSRLS